MLRQNAAHRGRRLRVGPVRVGLDELPDREAIRGFGGKDSNVLGHPRHLRLKTGHANERAHGMHAAEPESHVSSLCCAETHNEVDEKH